MKTYFPNYKSFKDTLLYNHLPKYNPGKAGTFKNPYTGIEKSYPHILCVPEGISRVSVIKKLLLLDNVNPDMFKKPQQYAHHLNSSQVICYEFFRPFLFENGICTNQMFKFLDKNGIRVESGPMSAQFEYIIDKKERTNFDLYLAKDTTNIYIEVKYTEDGFGSCKKDSIHREKFEAVYKPLIGQCGCLSCVPSFDEFCKYYQLFRNILRVTKDNDYDEYVIFIFPRANNAVEKQFTEFSSKFIKGTYSRYVVGIRWEDCLEFMSSRFRDKFFYYAQ